MYDNVAEAVRTRKHLRDDDNDQTNPEADSHSAQNIGSARRKQYAPENGGTRYADAASNGIAP